MGVAIGILLAIVLALSWALISLARRNRLAHDLATSLEARDVLRQFAEQSLKLQSVREILKLAREAATAIFGCQRVVAFETGAEEGHWDVSIPGQEALPELPAAARGLFAWFKHNTAIAAATDLTQTRFGAMRGPMRQVMETYDVDVLMPLVANRQVMAAVGLSLRHAPSHTERELMRLFRLQATAACANVRLHVEAAHMVSLAREVDLASAVELALVPDAMEGGFGELRWAGYFESSDEAGSDFFGVYSLADGRIVVLIGDAIGVGLAGSMVSAVVKSCCDAIFDTNPSRLDPATLLRALNRALYRSRNPVHTSAFALVLDPTNLHIEYSNAGNPFPYHVAGGPAVTVLGVLSGSGPLLGDEVDARYKTQHVNMNAGDSLVLFTDGLVRARNSDGETFGERGLQRLLKKIGPHEPREMRQLILSAVAEYRGDVPFPDDVAMIVVG